MFLNGNVTGNFRDSRISQTRTFLRERILLANYETVRGRVFDDDRPLLPPSSRSRDRAAPDLDDDDLGPDSTSQG